MSSVRPEIRSIRTSVRPQEHGSGIRREMSRVRYRMSGNASLVIVVKTSSPFSPYGSTFPVSGSMISGMKWSSKTCSPCFSSRHSDETPGPMTSESP